MIIDFMEVGYIMIQIIFVIFVWVVPVMLMVHAFRIMDNETKQQFKTDFKQPISLFAGGLIIFGLLISLTGIILANHWLQHIGVVMIFVSWVTTSVISWVKGKTNHKQSTALVLIGIVAISVYIYSSVS